jgi:hypothetical protein
VAASVALKQAFVDHTPAAGAHLGSLDYFHLENPTTTPWATVASAISKYKGSNLPFVTRQEWLSKVREHGIEDAEKVPAIRLQDFYEAMEVLPALDVRKTLQVAPEVDYGLLTPEILEKYLDYQRN